MAKGVVSVTVGGIKRTLRVEIGLSLDIEAETGVGTMSLMRDFFAGNGRVGVALDVLRIALAANGATYSPEDMRANLAVDGIMPTITAATQVLAALFDKPAGAEKEAAKKNGTRITTTSEAPTTTQ